MIKDQNAPINSDWLGHTSRRRFMATVASGMLSVRFLNGGTGWANDTRPHFGEGRARRVIYLFMEGGMSQFETLAPKPGSIGAINTRVAGIELGEHLPELATHANDLAVIRSMTTESGIHETAREKLRRGCRAIAPGGHPLLGTGEDRVLDGPAIASQRPPTRLQKALDTRLEPAAVRESYGSHEFGRGCLQARRLALAGVRCVEVRLRGWDDHRRLFNSLPHRARILDQGMSALLKDLKSRSMLDETLVVLATEFGRQPEINQNQGRDHQTSAFSCALAGGGIIGGQVYGKTDASGRLVEENPVTIEDFNHTIAYALGIDYTREIKFPVDQPLSMSHAGQPVRTLFGRTLFGRTLFGRTLFGRTLFG